MLKNAAQYRELFIPLLKDLRLRKSLTQVEVAARLKVPQSYVSKYETGERRLDFVETALVCSALGISLEELARTFSAKLRKFAAGQVKA